MKRLRQPSQAQTLNSISPDPVRFNDTFRSNLFNQRSKSSDCAITID